MAIFSNNKHKKLYSPCQAARPVSRFNPPAARASPPPATHAAALTKFALVGDSAKESPSKGHRLPVVLRSSPVSDLDGKGTGPKRSVNLLIWNFEIYR